MTHQQLGLFYSPIPEPVKQVPPKTLSREELWKLFRLEYEAAKLYPRTPVLIEIPSSKAITQMARMQVRDYKTSKRARQDCDLLSLLGKVAWSVFLGQESQQVFSDWENALGKGNRGVFWHWPGEAVGLRTTSGDKTRFFITKNRFSDRVTSYAFARVQTQHSGVAFVELLGWAQRYQIGELIRDHGGYWSVDTTSLQRHGLLQSAHDLKQQFMNH